MVRALATALLLLPVCCAPANYVYRFDLNAPHARNIERAGERALQEDEDFTVGVVADPTVFQAILFEFTNKTPNWIEVAWSDLSLVVPTGNELRVRPDVALGPVGPGTKVAARLIPFSLPDRGAAAEAYEGSLFELVVPIREGGVTRVLRYPMTARLVRP